MDPLSFPNIPKATDQPTLHFLWPKDSQTLGLSPQGIKRLDAALKALQNDHTPRSRSAYTALSSGAPFQSVHSKKNHRLARSVVFTPDHLFVSIPSKNGLPVPPVHQGKKPPKYVWDAKTGTLWQKARIITPIAQTLLRSIHQSQWKDKWKAVPEIGAVMDQDGKSSVIQRSYPHNLQEATTRVQITQVSIGIEHLVFLQNALKAIHDRSCKPATLVKEHGRHLTKVFSGYHGPCFHGDINPQNVLCEPDADGNLRLFLTGLEQACPDKVHWTPGWASPETIRFANSTKEELCEAAAKFNRKYGQKRDLWALGLLLCTVLRGGEHPDHRGKNLPHLNCILRHIVKKDGTIDESGLLNLTQAEINQELDVFERTLGLDTHPKGEVFKVIIGMVRKWLRVDPDSRPCLSKERVIARFL